MVSSSNLFFLVTLTLVVGTFGGHVTFYSQPNHQGSQKTYYGEKGKCVNLDGELFENSMSINTHAQSVYLYPGKFCNTCPKNIFGFAWCRKHAMVPYNSDCNDVNYVCCEHHSSLKECGYADKAASFRII